MQAAPPVGFSSGILLASPADGNMSREPDGAFNEDYCKWCYTDGAFTYQSMDALIDFCAAHMANDAFPPAQVRAYLQDLLPKLKHWQIAENK